MQVGANDFGLCRRCWRWWNLGGIGSGRHGGTVTIEATASFVLSVGLVVRQALRLGQRTDGTVTFEFRSLGEVLPVRLVVDARDTEYPFIELQHHSRGRAGGGDELRYRVDLGWTFPHFGGRRLWFLCPESGDLAAKLYLPLGGSRFLSRKAYRLAYACQRETALDRRMRRARKLHVALGGVGGGEWDKSPPKPQRMRWTTYERRRQAWERAARLALNDWAKSLAR